MKGYFHPFHASWSVLVRTIFMQCCGRDLNAVIALLESSVTPFCQLFYSPCMIMLIEPDVAIG